MRRLRHFIILDDATRGVQKQTDWETPGGVNPIADVMTMGQAYNIGLGILCHSLSTLSEIVRQNASFYITTGLPTENPRLINDTFATTYEQAEKIRALKINEFVIFNPALHDKPVLARFEKPVIPGLLDETIRKAKVAEFLKDVIVGQGLPLSAFQPHIVSKKQSSIPSVTGEKMQMLVLCGPGKSRPAILTYDAMNVSRAQGRAIAKSLEAEGYLIFHIFSTGKVGGKLCFFEVTEAGWDILKRQGYQKKKKLTDGGWEHELAARLIRQWAKKNHLTISFEAFLPGTPGIRMDCRLVDQTGQKTYVNIGISNPQREVKAIVKYFQLPVSMTGRFLLVARDSQFRQAVTKELKKHHKALLDKIEIKLIADYVDKS